MFYVTSGGAWREQRTHRYHDTRSRYSPKFDRCREFEAAAELQRLCVEYLDDDADTLNVVRLVNNELGNIATKVLFSKAILNPTDESAEKFMELMHCKYGDEVRCVVINTSLDPDLEYWNAGALPESEVLPSFADAIGSLSSFRNLQELKDAAETPEFRNEILKIVLGALEEITALDVLSIKNLQDHTDRQILKSDAFPIHRGFTTDLPELWLKPALSHLTHLTLYSYTCMWGLFPFVDFRNIGTFPSLPYLSLGNFAIAHDWQVDWILSHGPTLKQLLLDDCPIITALKMEVDMVKVAFPKLHSLPESMRPDWNGCYFKEISLRWHDVFDRFRSGLPHLQHFAACGSEHWTNDAFDHRYELTNRSVGNRYYVFDCGSVPPWRDFPERSSHNFYRRGSHPNSARHVEFPRCYDEDVEALGRLMKVANERARIAV
ncbi:uncharacterized protein EKO05_0011431 [Ascochyta rabiei]|uniref:uncharacterized protein n=1 Tax=Didymella rabiei TaxID=5454 RepID=UPI00220BF77D|nr:uncharacterized protein EKO05_0011431 [Ascochyta rabiei]UPX21238.1 hypothetical protein EKO05_0011431 [Ascochyta rabiei]